MKKDHNELIYDIGEMSGLFTDAPSLDVFLSNIVQVIARHMHADVCSIYLYSTEDEILTLKATQGLNAEFIGNIHLKIGEGLTGLALKELRPICEQEASANPNFRYFPGLGEEQYESFLAVPIIRGTTMIGAMVIQNTKRHHFNQEDVNVLRAITSQLANTIEMTRLFLSLHEQQQSERHGQPAKTLTLVKGKSGSQGFACGQAVIFDDHQDLGLWMKDKVSQTYTLEDLRHAVRTTELKMNTLQVEIEETLSDVASLIFTAQILMLKDPGFMDAIEELIIHGMNPPFAVVQVVEEYIEKFNKLPNAYLREKSQDVRDIGRRLLESLLGHDHPFALYDGCVVIAREILPSDALKLSSQKVVGFVLLRGGVTSHVSILAQSLGIPLLIADEWELLNLPQGTNVMVDADEGLLHIDPSEAVRATYKEREDVLAEQKVQAKQMDGSTFTSDGTRIRLNANVNLFGDVQTAEEYKAEGVGLYRTEFPFIVRSDFPTEEEQFVIYQKLTKALGGKPMTFRTLDIGGDKVLSYFQDHSREENPFLGMRSIRFSLRYEDIFVQQIRAILRAGTGSDLRIMFPMISSLDEFLAARRIVEDCQVSLRREGLAFHHKPQVGLMVELPATLEILDELAVEADFFSVGTNDFIQYMLAVDRTNEKVSDFYLPYHPAILRGLNRIASAGRAHGLDVSICGDMAHDERYLPFLLGIGITNFSVNPQYLPRLQRFIQNFSLKDSEALIQRLLQTTRLKEIEQILCIDRDHVV